MPLGRPRHARPLWYPKMWVMVSPYDREWVPSRRERGESLRSPNKKAAAIVCRGFENKRNFQVESVVT